MANQNINCHVFSDEESVLDLDIKTEVRFSRKDHPEGKMVPVSIDGKDEFILIPLDIKDGETIKFTGRGKHNPRSGKTGDLYVLVHIDEKKVPWVKWIPLVLVSSLLISICAIFFIDGSISQERNLTSSQETLKIDSNNSETIRSEEDMAYENAEAHCRALGASGNYDEIVRYLTEVQRLYKDDLRYAQLLSKYEKIQKNSILESADNFAQNDQYRMAIQEMDNAWNTYGDLEYFNKSAQYRQDFGIYNTSCFAAGKYNTILIRADSSVDVVGDSSYGELGANSWSNIVAVSAGDRHVVGLRADGTVVAEGENRYEQCNTKNWRDVIAISAGDVHTVALLADGSLIATGYDAGKQCQVKELMNAAGEKRIVAISAGYLHTFALLEDGTVIACGDNSRGACDVLGWTDIVAIYTGTMYSAGLKSDGSVVITGEGKNGKDVSTWDVSDWSDVVNMAAGDYYLIALRSDGTILSAGLENGYLEDMHHELESWNNIIQVAAGNDHTIGLTADGKLLCTGSNNYNQCDLAGTFINITQRTHH